ncbi:MAG: 50S ribosomal protein L24 [Alphaproteobacteria bacterium]|nr:50S ribosomal protein L24 [Alphaproteobacteria bacterium]
MKVKKGDRVMVITGRDKGKVGTVLRAIPTESRVIVEGVNIVKRHQRQSVRDQGGVVEKEAAIHVSNVSHIDPRSSRPTRVGFKKLDDGRKVRVARRSGEVIDV